MSFFFTDSIERLYGTFRHAAAAAAAAADWRCKRCRKESQQKKTTDFAGTISRSLSVVSKHRGDPDSLRSLEFWQKDLTCLSVCGLKKRNQNMEKFQQSSRSHVSSSVSARSFSESRSARELEEPRSDCERCSSCSSWPASAAAAAGS